MAINGRAILNAIRSIPFLAIGCAIPILLVNSIAIVGQLEFWHTALPWPFAAVALFAIALESIAVFLAYHAHLSQVSNDSSLRLRWASYAMGIVIGLLNASHYLGPNHTITAAAVGIGIMSAISPWLWAVHTKRKSRDKLKAAGLIDSHAVRLGMNRWLWHPLKSFGVMRMAAWNGEATPTAAIHNGKIQKRVTPIRELVKPKVVIETPVVTNGTGPRIIPAATRGSNEGKPKSRNTGKLGLPTETDLSFMDSKADAVRYALNLLGNDAKAQDISDWLANHGQPNISPSYVRVTKGRLAKATA